ncbi:MAG TPA: class I SAM-dependent methyltransferase [Candidatus Methanoperedenaceae archaeon]|nr:class I SAM-dependent methyltransferase [Candidatus Methanoperedenaceae archaeon]
MHHILAWNREHERNCWKGPYSLRLFEKYMRKGTVLDAGCGSGRYTIPLASRGFNTTGIDVATKAIRRMLDTAGARGLQVDSAAADVTRLPFRDSSFDAVMCYGMLQHLLVDERKMAISELSRVLKKGGYMFIEVFGEEDMRSGGDEVEKGSYRRKSGVIYHYFSWDELNWLLGGFELVELTERKSNCVFRGVRYMRHMFRAAARKP